MTVFSTASGEGDHDRRGRPGRHRGRRARPSGYARSARTGSRRRTCTRRRTRAAGTTRSQELGFNYRITDFQCALGLSQLQRLDELRRRAERDRRALPRAPRRRGAGSSCRPRRPRASLHGYHLFVIRVRAGPRRGSPSSTRCAPPASACRCTTSRSTGCRTTATRSASRRTRGRPTEDYYAGAISLPIFPGLAEARRRAGGRGAAGGAAVKVERRLEPSRRGCSSAQARVIPAYTQTLSKNPDAVGAGRRAGVRLRAPRARTSGTSTATGTSTSRWRSGPIILGLRPPRGERGDRAPAARRDRLHAPAPDRGRGRRADRRPGARRRARPFAKTGSDATTASVRARAGLHRPRRRHRLRLPRLARLVHRDDLARRSASRKRCGRSPTRSPSTTSTRSTPRSSARPGRRRRSCWSPSAPTSLRPASSRASSTARTPPARSSSSTRSSPGFRLAPGGAQERYGVVPDLAAFGKALGQRHADLGSRRDRPSTWTGSRTSSSRGRTAARRCRWRRRTRVLDELTPELYETLFSRGERLRTGVQDGIDEAGVGELGDDRRRGAEDGDGRSRAGELGRAAARAKHRAAGAPQARRPLQRLQLHLRRPHRRGHRPRRRRPIGEAFGVLADALRTGDLEAALEGSPVQPAFRAL